MMQTPRFFMASLEDGAMGRSCREIHEWIEEQVERPIEEWEERQEERCREEECNWWMLCLNKLFCWLVTVLVKVVRWVVVTVGKWVVRVVCEIVNFVLDVIGFIVGLILAIPVIGGIIRTVLNWVLEVVWRIVGIFEFLGSLVGIRLRKKMYFGIVIPVINDTPLITEAQAQPWSDAATEIYDRTCNVDLRFTGFCETGVQPPGGTITVDCGVGGFFADWWLDGSWFEFVPNTCKFQSNWRRVTGFGGEIIVFMVNGFSSNSLGCSMSGTHNYVTVLAPPPGGGVVGSTAPFNDTVAHEIGHACLLWHTSTTGNTNLMDTGGRSTTTPVLDRLQVAMVRSSRHCVYI